MFLSVDPILFISANQIGLWTNIPRKKRHYQNKPKSLNSRRLSYFPEFLEISKTRNFLSITHRKQFYNFSDQGIINILPIFIILYFCLKICINSTKLYQIYWSFFFDVPISYLNSWLISYLLVLLPHTRVLGSNFFDSALVNTCCCWFLMNIENFFFFNERPLIYLFIAYIGFSGVIAGLWKQPRFNSSFKYSYSTKINQFREIRILLTIFFSLKTISKTGIFLSNIMTNVTSFSPFFFDLSIFTKLHGIVQMITKSLLTNSGGDLFFNILALLFLYYRTFLQHKQNNSVFFVLMSAKFIFRHPYLNFGKIKSINTGYESIFLKRDEKSLMYLNELINKDYFEKNFPNQKNFDRWKIRKLGINIIFPIAMRCNELPLKKKSQKWQVKTKKK